VEKQARQVTVRKAVKLKDGSNSEARDGKMYCHVYFMVLHHNSPNIIFITAIFYC
jgi:hypothetical protein